MSNLQFEEVGRLPACEDNVAISIRTLPQGTRISYKGSELILDHTVLEGHRFAVASISEGKALLSWGLPFGFACRPIAPGNYVCNQRVLEALSGRNLDLALPRDPNFVDRIDSYCISEVDFQPGPQVTQEEYTRTFLGYNRSPSRGVGTRNYIVILGTSSRTASYARALAERLQTASESLANVDGIVPIAHTEGAHGKEPNNLDLVLTTLSGFLVHPNVGAILAVDRGTEAVTNVLLRQHLSDKRYPFQEVLHRFLTLEGSFQDDLDRGAQIVESWLPQVNSYQRSSHSFSGIRAALQCGGSDAFSGISANPLSGWVARAILRQGGSANLAETDELIGAESYVLRNVRNLKTAQAFLRRIEHFQKRAAWHGESAQGNPSGGNILRGLYNIGIKSLGAATKRHPDVRLDYVIDYGQPMKKPGFYFMDSPGNDLESVAGQVASGANLIFFTTGNGSITNFPFVPTIKIVTTSGRFRLLSKDMDVNAGVYLEGTSMSVLGQELLELTTRVVSGQQSVGEKAGHSQISLWRNWEQTDSTNRELLQNAPKPQGKAIQVKETDSLTGLRFDGIPTRRGWVTRQVGLILPTSLCSGQIAHLIAQHLNTHFPEKNRPISRFIALPHTEGCGCSAGLTRQIYARTLLGHLTHPTVAAGLLLEHGCEATHNDYMKNQLERMGVGVTGFGSASVQLDGGIDKVTHKVETWFEKVLLGRSTPNREPVGLEALRVAVLTSGTLSSWASWTLSKLVQILTNSGATIVFPGNDNFLKSDSCRDILLLPDELEPSLAFGEHAGTRGLHIMDTSTDHWVEILTGLGATGAEILLAWVSDEPVQGHVMLPTLQIGNSGNVSGNWTKDLDLLLDSESESGTDQILSLILDLASGRYTPILYAQGNVDFQITRGPLGVSL